jgi:uncharacterized membrane protein
MSLTIENCRLLFCGWNPLFQLMGFGVAFEILKTARYMKSGMKYPAII